MNANDTPAGVPTGRDFSNMAALAFSDRGMILGTKLTALYPQLSLNRCGKGMLSAWSREHFPKEDALIYIGAAGIAIRGIAPLVESKMADPAVLVIDELGQFVIPVLSGHVGGANALAREIAEAIGAVPVITTATDINKVFAVDTWAVSQGLFITNPLRIKHVSSTLLDKKDIRLISKYAIAGTIPNHVVPMADPLEEAADADPGEAGGPDCDLLITWDAKPRKGSPLRLVAPAVTLGVGCRKDIAQEAIEELYQQLLEETGIHPAAVCEVTSIDLKAEEKGLLKFAAAHGLPFHTYPAEDLSQAPGEYAPSEFVRSVTGVDNVCERAAVLGACERAAALGAEDPAAAVRVLVHKTALHGVTMALALTPPRLRWD